MLLPAHRRRPTVHQHVAQCLPVHRRQPTGAGAQLYMYRTALAEVMEALLSGGGDEHDYGADCRHNPSRCELQRRSLVSLRHCLFSRPPVLDPAFLLRLAESNL